MRGRLISARFGAVLLTLFGLVVGMVVPTRAEGPWSTLKIDYRSGFTVVTVGDRVLIGGGSHIEYNTSQLVYDAPVHIYDGTTGAWSTGQLSTGRVSPVGATVGDLALFIGGRALVDAGRRTHQPSDIVDIYDSLTDSWSVTHLSFADAGPRVTTVGTQVLIESVVGPNAGKIDVFDSGTRSIAPMSSARPASGGDRIVANGIMLVMRRFQGPGIWSLDEPLDLYDSRRGAWSTLSLPTPRRKVGVAVAGPLILFAGGEVDGQPVDTVDIYDTTTGGWSSATLNAPSSSAAGLTIGQRALFFGDTMDVYDGGTGTWSTTSPPVPLKGEPTVRGTVAVWSLSTTWSEHDPAPQVVIYESDRNVWHTGALSVPRANYAIAAVGTRVLFAGGGQEGEGKPNTLKKDLNIVDIYDLATQTWSQGQLQKGRETIHTTTVAGKALFIGGITGCNSCSAAGDGPIVDIYDPSAG